MEEEKNEGLGANKEVAQNFDPEIDSHGTDGRGEKIESISKIENTESENDFDSILDVNEDIGTIEDKKDENTGLEVSEEKDKINQSDPSYGTRSSFFNNHIKNIIIGVLVILVIIFVWLWQGNSQDNKNTSENQKNNDTVVVSDKKEQGTVRIVEGNNANFGIDNNTLLEANQVEIIAYYGNSQKNKPMIDCSIVFPLHRIIEKKYDSEFVNTMKGLLQPLTADEISRGFTSAIPQGVAIKYIKIASGVAEVDFNDNLYRIGGSCAVTAVRAQIEKTLLQFPQVKSVLICVDGNCKQDAILQP
ncbi:MAG: GerMN domain-containing protein [Patescibacteria group bacterium]|jgi:hypothetical protein